jgi:hypothetical protein
VSLGTILVDFKVLSSRLHRYFNIFGLFLKHLAVLWIVYDFWHNTTKNEEYRFLAAAKIIHDGVDCKRVIENLPGCPHVSHLIFQ